MRGFRAPSGGDAGKMQRLPLLTVVVLAAAATVVASARGAVPAPAAAPPLASFRGLDSSQLPGANPPDVQVAAGAAFVVEAVNASIAIWSTAGGGTTLVRSLPLPSFFSGGGVDRGQDEMTDPRILYDTRSGRWFASIFDITRLELDLAVSATSTPTDSWSIFAFPSSGCPDQPRLGTSDTAVVLTDDFFSSCERRGVFVGGEILVLDKQDVVAGVAQPRASRYGPNAAFASITPVVSLSPTTTEYLVATAQSNRAIRLLSVRGTDQSSIPSTDVGLRTPLPNPPAAPQAGSDVPVDTGDNRVQNAVWENGRLWLTSGAACTAAASRACARVIQVATTGPRLVADTQIDLGTRWLFYPAIYPDADENVAVAYGFSSPADDPSLGSTYIRPDGSAAAPTTVAGGTSPNTSERFGDYFGAARDPADPARVWIAGELGAAVMGSTLDWATQVGAVAAPRQRPAVNAPVAKVSGTRATVSSVVFPEGSTTRYRMQYGLTARFGRQTALRTLPVVHGDRAVTIALAGLARGRTYHVRIVATNAVGTAVSSVLLVRPPRR